MDFLLLVANLRDAWNYFIGWISDFVTLAEFIGAVGAVYAIPCLNQYNQFKQECESALVPYRDRKETLENYYIHTKGQDNDPCDDPDFPGKDADKEKVDLINLFMTKEFRSNTKYYLILGDSGMGKTTFLLKLYQTYMNNFELKWKKRKMKLVQLGGEDPFREINRIKDNQDVNSTILLLDSFDEYETSDPNGTFDRLAKETQSFYKVIITCRTQYFANADKEPSELPVISHSISGKNEIIYKKYLSPFTDDEVKEYLRKRFRNNPDMQKKAQKIMNNEGLLLARPMILSWIDQLCVGDAVDYKYSTDVYHAIIEKWLHWEPVKLIKDKNGHKVKDQKTAVEKLRKFCLAVAEEMMKSDSEKPLISHEKIKIIAEQDEINLDALSSEQRSLLNRDADGNWKFSHRSFYEYLTAWLWQYRHQRWMDSQYKGYSVETKEFIAEEKIKALRKSLCEYKLNRKSLGKDKYVEFGWHKYDGSKTLEWIVLEITRDKALLISKDILLDKAYHSIQKEIDWKNSDVRNWLNTEFNTEYFYPCERKIISQFKHDGITDEIFLLSQEEVETLLPDKDDRKLQRTWWLRNCGRRTDYAMNVTYNGIIDSKGLNVNNDEVGVRPALWISLK